MVKSVKATKSAHLVKDARLGIRLPADVRDKLQALADRERRSISSYVERLLAEHVEAVSTRKKGL